MPSPVHHPLPPWKRTAAGLGYVTVVPEWDGVLRRIPNIMRYRQDNVYPSLAVAAAANYLKVKAGDIVATGEGDGGVLHVAGRDVPLNKDGETLINWLGVGAIPTYTFNQLFDNQNKADFTSIFKDRVVVIGVTAAGAYEGHSTPFAPNQAAVELQANVLDNILSNRLLRGSVR